jgi:hypothetical protein
MKNLFKIWSIIGLTVITQTAYSGEVTATFTTGDILTAEKLKNIKSAVNDNDTRISNIALTPGPAGAASTVAGPKGDAGADSTVAGPPGPAGADSAVAGARGADGSAGSNGSNGADGTPCTVEQGDGSATFTCGGGNTMASVYGMTTSAEQGDMQYYDGSAWVVVNSPTDTTVVNTLSIVNGTPSWAPTYYEIGDRGPAGGFVFVIYGDGLHGLEAAPPTSDIFDSQYTFGCGDDYVSDATGALWTLGMINTSALLSCDGGSPAATAASEFALNGFDDWHMPSRDALLILGGAVSTHAGFPSYPGGYWSSSQVVNVVSNAYASNIPGAPLSWAKAAAFYVVPVRSF